MLASCDVNDLQPQTAFSDELVFDSPSYIALAVTGVYDAAQSGTWPGTATGRGYPFGAAHVQQGDNRAEDMVSVAAFYGVTYQNAFDATSPNNNFMWSNLYRLINRANLVIEGVQGAASRGVITQEQANIYEGECRFLRALAHHQLLVHWARPFSDNPSRANGGVPYRTIGVSGGADVELAIAVPRGTVAEDYTALLADLDFAETNLPATRPATLLITRATKAAAIALKTRIRLHQNNWEQVLTEGNKLAPQATAPFTSPIGGRSLTATPMGPFGAGNKNNTESIFSIEHNDVDNAGVNAALPTMYTPTTRNGRAIVAISPILWNQPWFLESDIRKSTEMIDRDSPTGQGRGGIFTRKYVDVVNNTDNAPIIRYAEVLLNMAEASARLNGVNARAVALLNAVRNRAVTDAASQFTIASFPTATSLIQAILNERRIEFIAEGHRWSDVHRLAQDPNFSVGGIPAKVDRTTNNFAPLYTGNPATTLPLQAGIPYSDRRFLWPIPSEELANNATLSTQQNPGW
jgi:starch-binding outer membrane protein, SusD/RagB family